MQNLILVIKHLIHTMDSFYQANKHPSQTLKGGTHVNLLLRVKGKRLKILEKFGTLHSKAYIHNQQVIHALQEIIL